MNESGHKVPACYLELREEGEVEISTCPPPTPSLSHFFLLTICMIECSTPVAEVSRLKFKELHRSQ